MELGFFPRSFTVKPGVSPSPDGPIATMRVIVQDVSGAVVTITFGTDDFANFQRAVADPTAAAAAAEARSRIVLARPGMSQSVKQRKH